MRWAFHATGRDEVDRILAEGLIPQEQRHVDEERGADGPATFFCPTPQLAGTWNHVVLRFPWPEDAEPDPFGDAFVLETEVTYTNWYTRTTVPPSLIVRLD